MSKSDQIFLWILAGLIYMCLQFMPDEAHASVDLRDMSKSVTYKLIHDDQIWPTISDMEEYMHKMKEEIARKKGFRHLVVKVNNQIFYYGYAQRLSNKYLSHDFKDSHNPRALARAVLKQIKRDKPENLHAIIPHFPIDQVTSSSTPVHEFFEYVEGALNDIAYIRKDNPKLHKDAIWRLAALRDRIKEMAEISDKAFNKQEIVELLAAADAQDFAKAEIIYGAAEQRFRKYGATVITGSTSIEVKPSSRRSKRVRDSFLSDINNHNKNRR